MVLVVLERSVASFLRLWERMRCCGGKLLITQCVYLKPHSLEKCFRGGGAGGTFGMT